MKGGSVMEKILENDLLYDEMEEAEELGDGWFLAGVGAGVAGGVVVWICIAT